MTNPELLNTDEIKEGQLPQSWTVIFFIISSIVFGISLLSPVYKGEGVVVEGFFAFFFGWMAHPIWYTNLAWLTAVFLHLRKKYLGALILSLVAFVWASQTFFVSVMPNYGNNVSDFELQSGFYLWYSLFVFQVLFEGVHLYLQPKNQI